MPYGTIKVDNIVFTNAGVDQTIGVSGLVQSVSGNLTVTGTISGNLVRGTTVSGATITGGALTVTSGVFAPGASGAPSISFAGDSNTGFWSPAGDTVAISTGGSERIRVDSAGDLGVGTTDPTSRLTVRADAASGPNTIIRVENRAASAGATTQNIKIEGIFDYNNGTSDASAGAIVFGKDGTYTTATTNNDSYLALETVLNNTSTERLRITSDGKVGIGLSSPNTSLEVNGIITALSGAFDAGGYKFTYAGSVDSRSWWLANDVAAYGDFSIRQSTTQTGSTYASRFHIAPDGKVGIGTSSPSANGLVTIAETTNARLYLTDSTLGNSYGAQLRGYGVGGAGGYAELGVVDADTYSKAITVTEQANAIVFSRGTTERARIDSSGRLLVGTSTSVNNLLDAAVQIAGTSADSYLSITRFSSVAGDPAGIILGRSKSATKGVNSAVSNGDYLGAITFSGANGTSYTQAANIGAEVDGAVSGGGAGDMPGRLIFSTTADGASSPTERLRIDSSGRVGIGTSTIGTNHVLELSGNQKYLAVITNAGAGGTANPSASNGLFLGWNRSNGEGESNIVYGIGAGSAPRLEIGSWNGTTYTETARFTSGGNFMVGTLDVRGGRAEFVSGTSNSNADYSGSAASFVGPGLIGTASTRATISVEDNSAMALNVGGSIGFGGRYLTSNSLYAQWAAIAGKKETGTSGEYGGYLGFYTRIHATNAIDERARITSSGNMGIGTTQIYNRFTVYGAQATEPVLAVTLGPLFSHNTTNNVDTTALQTVLSLGRAGKNGFSFANQVNFNIGRYSQSGSTSNTQLTLRLTQGNVNDPDTDLVSFLSNGYVRMAASTGGIQFNGDTAAENALDDYEEGTWTPTVIGTTTTGTATYSLQSGTYTKVGREVTVTCLMNYSGGTGAGSLRVSGLPFVSSNIANRIFLGTISLVNIPLTAGHQGYCSVDANQTTIGIDSFATAGGTAINIAYDGTGVIYATITYVV